MSCLFQVEPYMNYDQRKMVIENVKGVDIVVPQTSRDYEENPIIYKPAYMIHGSDWREGHLAKVNMRK